MMVVIAVVIARRRGWTPAGKFRLGSYGWPVTILAIAYQIATIVILCDKTPPFGTSFFDRWFVPISAAIVAAIGILYYVIVRPKRQVLDPAESVSAEPSASVSPGDFLAEVFDVADRVAVVVGGTSGIGEAARGCAGAVRCPGGGRRSQSDPRG